MSVIRPVAWVLAMVFGVSGPGTGQTPPGMVDQDPLVRLGTGTRPGHDFYRVRGAVRLDDGTIVVADGSSRELRFFDGLGGLVRTVGRRGAGPGEFEEMEYGLGRLTGDTLVALDRALRRVTRVSPAGVVVDTRLLPDSDFGQRPSLTVQASGVLVAGLSPPSDPTIRGVYRVRTVVAILDPITMRADTVGTIDGPETVRASEGSRSHTILRPYGRDPTLAAAGDSMVFVGDTGDRIVSVMKRGQTGLRAVGTIEVPEAPGPVTSAHRKAVLDRYQSTPSRAATLRAIGDMPFPRQLPAYKGILSDRLGLLWIQAYPALGQTNAKWWVFDPSGPLVGILENPPEGRILEIGPGHILTVRLAADDTEVVELYALRRGSLQ